METIRYDSIYLDATVALIKEFFRETKGIEANDENATRFVEHVGSQDNKALALVRNNTGDLVGFVLMTVNNHYGMTEAVLDIEYSFIRKEYRNTVATSLLLIEVAEVATQLGMDIECEVLADSTMNKVCRNIGLSVETIRYSGNLDKVIEIQQRLDRIKQNKIRKER